MRPPGARCWSTASQFLAAFFPIVVNTYGGVCNIGRGLVEIASP
jgi:hypothetical protein